MTTTTSSVNRTSATQEQFVIDRLTNALKNDHALSYNETTGVVDMNTDVVPANPFPVEHGTFGAARVSAQEQAVIDRLTSALKSDSALAYDETTGVVDMNADVVPGNPLSIDYGTFGAACISAQEQAVIDRLCESLRSNPSSHDENSACQSSHLPSGDSSPLRAAIHSEGLQELVELLQAIYEHRGLHKTSDGDCPSEFPVEIEGEELFACPGSGCIHISPAAVG